MGLAVESVSDSLMFVRKYPKTLLFQTIITSIIFVSTLAAGLGIIYSLPSSALLNFGGAMVLFAIIVIVFSAIQVGGYPLLVQQAVKKKKVDVLAAIRGSASRIVSVLAAIVAQTLILIVPLIPIILAYVASLSYLTSALGPSDVGIFSSLTQILPIIFGLALVGSVALIYLSLRLFYTFPILMLEKKGAIDSIKASWHNTKGKLLSIFGATLLMGLIFIIGSMIVQAVFALGGVIATGLGSAIAAIIFGTISGVFPAVFYLNAKNKR